MIAQHIKTKRKYLVLPGEINYKQGLIKVRTLAEIKGSDILQRNMLKVKQWEKLKDFKIEVDL